MKLETRKKLRGLNLFEPPDNIQKVNIDGGYYCRGNPANTPGYFCCQLKECYLPNPTIEELINAIDKKTDVKWGIERQKENGSWLVWFREKIKIPNNETGVRRHMFPSETLPQALADTILYLEEHPYLSKKDGDGNEF